MSIRVECQACGASHSLNRRLLGRTIRCPICDAAMEVPADSPTIQDADDDLVETEGVELVGAEDIETGLVETELVDADLIDGEIVDTDLIDGELIDGELIDGELVDGELIDGELVDGELVDGELVDVSSSDSEPVVVEAVAAIKASESDVEAVDSMVRTARAEDDEEEEIAFAKRELPKDDMDMTPMVDVTFLLLIFFMITASFTSEKVLEEPPPLSDSSTNAKEEPDKIQDTVRVQVDEFNAYTIILPGGEDRQASSKQDLIIALEDARKELVTGVNDNALKMAVEAHTESIHAAVVAAVDAAREKGFSSIQVTVVEEFD